MVFLNFLRAGGSGRRGRLVPVDPTVTCGGERDKSVRLGGDGDQLADVGLAVVAAEALQGAGAGAGERELGLPTLALVAPGRPELTVVAEADRVWPLAVERRLQRLPEARRREGQVE